MKIYWDYTEKERADFTEEEVKALLDAELMTKGVLRPIEPEYEKIEDVKPEKKTFFECCGIVFDKIENAEKFLELNPLDEGSDWSLPDKCKYVKAFYDMDIHKIQLSEEREIDRLRSQLRKNKSAEDNNDKKQQEYNKAMKEVNKVLNGVWDNWYECKALKAKHQKVIDTYEEYKRMTDGNENLAYNFLLKVFSMDEIKDVNEWFGYELIKILEQEEVKQ